MTKLERVPSIIIYAALALTPLVALLANAQGPVAGESVAVGDVHGATMNTPQRTAFQPNRLSTGRLEIDLLSIRGTLECRQVERPVAGGARSVLICRTRPGAPEDPPPTPTPAPTPSPPAGPGPTPTPRPPSSLLAQVPAWPWQPGREVSRSFTAPPLTWATVTTRVVAPLGCAHRSPGGMTIVSLVSSETTKSGLLLQPDCSVTSARRGAADAGTVSCVAGVCRWVLQLTPGEQRLVVGFGAWKPPGLAGVVIGPTEVRK